MFVFGSKNSDQENFTQTINQNETQKQNIRTRTPAVGEDLDLTL